MSDIEITKKVIEKFVREQICLLGYAAPYETKSLDLDLLLEDLGLDSLDTMDIIMAAEEKFDVEVTDQEVDNFSNPKKNTSQDFIDYLENKLLG